jgi:thiamine biosynthesis lipoprotein
MPVVLRRARPALGTLVEMRVEGLRETEALRAIDAAFAEVTAVHRLMSFHEAGSDLARIHAAPPGSAVAVDARTFEVLQIARDVAVASRGVFDVTVAPRLVAWGRLPRPASPFTPDAHASWCDIELMEGVRVRLRRPLWLDLGGIAKGYAVDRAIEILRIGGATQACVNAGGDLRILGARAEPVCVRVDGKRSRGYQPLVELANAAIASSACNRHEDDESLPGPHVHGMTRAAVGGVASVSVIAERCVIADALTKVVLAGDGAITRTALAAFAARACTHDPASGWNIMACAA